MNKRVIACDNVRCVEFAEYRMVEGMHLINKVFLFSFSKKRKNILMAEQGVIPVYQNIEAHLRAPKIKGVVSHGAGVQYDYKWAFVEE
jgi:hypothetical protein